MNILIFDFEIFKYNTLLGIKLLDSNKIIQLWNEDDIRDFYYSHLDYIWIGHNNYSYDNLILEAIINNRSAYQKSKEIVENNERGFCNLKFYSYDVMRAIAKPFSLKLTELLTGKNIHTTDVDFNIDRPLTDEEKKLTEEYNKDDLKQTEENLYKFYEQFNLRLEIIKEFELDLMKNLNVTGTQLAANVLKAKKDPNIEFKRISPPIYDNLKLKNERLKQFYINEEFRQNKSDIINVAGADLTIAAGGLHSSIKKIFVPKVIYADVGGYYNRILINYNLLSRTIPEEGKKLYEFMFFEQLKLKKYPELINKRNSYKTVLLAVFGAMNNKHTDFYDPWKALLVTITGQLFLVDLLEKLEGLVIVIQSNTDGIALLPYDWNDEPKIIKIIEDWEQRTGFVIKKEHLYNLWQRDVNCYICQDEDGKIITRGDSVINYEVNDKMFASGKLFDCKEPPIIAQGIVDYLIKGILPEKTVEQKKDNLLLFQYACRKNTFDYLTYDTYVLDQTPRGREYEVKINEEIIKPLNRVFAEKTFLIDNKTAYHIVTKHKKDDKKGGMKEAKVSNLPPSVFIYNEDIRDKSTYEKLKDKIDYQYYIDRIYEKIMDFIPEGE